MDWVSHYPAYASQEKEADESNKAKHITQPVEIADIGCGFGGLLFALAPKFPNTLLLGETRLPTKSEREYHVLTQSPQEWKSESQ